MRDGFLELEVQRDCPSLERSLEETQHYSARPPLGGEEDSCWSQVADGDRQARYRPKVRRFLENEVAALALSGWDKSMNPCP